LADSTSRAVGGILLFLILLFSMPAGAGHTPATSGDGINIRTTTKVDVIGSFLTSDDLDWTDGSNGDQTVVGYYEHTNAIGGETKYSKDFSLDTGDKTAIDNNLKSTRALDFSASADGSPGGRMITDEAVMIDTINNGASGTLNEVSLCPLGSSAENSNSAAFSGRVVAGSSLDVAEVSLVTDTAVRAVASNADTPQSLTYTINAHGTELNNTTSNGAIGDATAFIDANVVQGNGETGSETSSLSYSDLTSVSGTFNLSKDFTYSS